MHLTDEQNPNDLPILVLQDYHLSLGDRVLINGLTVSCRLSKSWASSVVQVSAKAL